MVVLGKCYLCSEDVTDQDHRREVDCPGSNCPSQLEPHNKVFHEDCISTYLKRTKYSKDRCTGFPCPVVLSTGKQCSGYVCKMHLYYPTNETKKKKRLAAIVAAAAAPKAVRAPPAPKPKAGAHVAIAAIKRAAPEGSPKPLTNGTKTEPRVIPGLDPNDRATQRALVARLKAEATAPGGAKNATAGVRAAPANFVPGGVLKPNTLKVQEELARVPQGATLWEAIMAGQTANLERGNRSGGGGKFTTKLLRKKLGADAAASNISDTDCFTNDGTASECDSSGTSSTFGDVEEVVFGAENGSLQQLPNITDFPALAAAVTPTTPAAPADSAAVLEIVPGSAADPDPVVEYDIVYASEDGSYLVHDAVSNAYYMVQDVYGAGVQLVEVMGEDGCYYTCVGVRRSQLEAREERQRAWLQAQFAGDAPAAPPPVQPYGQAAAAGVAVPCGMAPPVIQEEDETDVESLMQLLCV